MDFCACAGPLNMHAHQMAANDTVDVVKCTIESVIYLIIKNSVLYTDLRTKQTIGNEKLL